MSADLLSRLVLSRAVPVVAIALVAMVGCASGDDEGSAGEDLETVSQELNDGDDVDLVHPTGVYFAKVKSRGSGCRRGTTTPIITEDGKSFLVLFSEYEATVRPGVAEDEKNCTLNIRLGSTEGLQYALASFWYEGAVVLDKPRMRGRHVARYFFDRHGEKVADKEMRPGPVDESYVFTDEIDPSRMVWSSCRRRDVLHVNTKLVVKNNPEASGEGYMNTSAAGGSMSMKWKFAFRRCPNPQD
jgi:hypothetical protein